MSDLLGLNDNMDNNYFIRFLASANCWKTGDEEVELTKILLDPTSVKSGWGKIQEGLAPDWHWDEELGVRGLRPGDTEDDKMLYKRGFSVDLYSKELGVRTWSSTSAGATKGFLKLYTDLNEQLSANENKVAVIEYLGSDAIAIGKGHSRIPNFKILGWRSDDSFELSAEAEFDEVPLELNGSTANETEEIPF